MKRIVLSVFILIAFFLCSCTPEIVSNGGVVAHGTPIPTAAIDEYNTDDDIVYVTKSGSKYHKENCTYLKNSNIPVSREQAIREGKEPCSKCLPDG